VASPRARVTIALYLIGGILELAGIGLVAFDIRDDRRRFAELRNRPPVRAATDWRQFGRSSPQRMFEQHRDPLESARRDAASAAAAQQRTGVHLAEEARAQRDALLDILAGNMARRTLGLWLLLIGIAVGTAANVIAQT
jgi:hypothetical protein